jgi:glycosyltransferase involved in cell wall biosynthesis
MSKLILLPGTTDVLGGTLVTLASVIKGCHLLGMSDRLLVLTRAGSLMEKYLEGVGLEKNLQKIEADTDSLFIKQGLKWLNTQPTDYPLLMDNCLTKQVMSILLSVSPKLRFSERRLDFFFHDLALSYNYIGYLLRKLTLSTLAPIGLCNSYFTAKHVERFVRNVPEVLYQPIDPEQYNDRPLVDSPPEELKSILDSKARLLLIPSRLNKPGIVNDKNLRSLIPVLVKLKEMGHHYHGAIVGEDSSAECSHSRTLLEAARQANISERFSILN